MRPGDGARADRHRLLSSHRIRRREPRTDRTASAGAPPPRSRLAETAYGRRASTGSFMAGATLPARVPGASSARQAPSTVAATTASRSPCLDSNSAWARLRRGIAIDTGGWDGLRRGSVCALGARGGICPGSPIGSRILRASSLVLGSNTVVGACPGAGCLCIGLAFRRTA
jgi:hypothetical protein